MGKAAQRLVTTASILSVTVCFFRTSAGVYVSLSAPWMNAYLASTMADSVPASPSSRSILLFSSKRAAMISSWLGRASRILSTSASFSRYLMASQRVEYLVRISSFFCTRSLMRSMLVSIS